MGAELTRRTGFRLLSGIRGGRVELLDSGRRFAFGPADAELRTRIEIHDPRAYRWALRGSTGLGEGYVEGLWTMRRPRRAAPDRLPQPAAARPPARRRFAAAARPAQRLGRPGPAQHPGRRRAEHLRPLRPRQPLFGAFLDPRLDVLVRASSTSPSEPRGRPAGEARADLHGAGPRARRPPARDRHRLGRARDPRRRDPRLPGDDDDDLARAARLRGRAGARRGARRPGRGPAHRLPRPRGHLRQARLDRDDRGGRLAVLPRVLRHVRGSSRGPAARCSCRRS